MSKKQDQLIKWSDVVEPQKATHGVGFTAFRHSDSLFGGLLNPVLNIDHYFMTQPTFPPHPHAGFSAITYMFEDSENGFLNRDSLGNEIIINPGDLHWTQAAKGILHEETPLKNGPVCHGLQIFINLPKKLKGTEPKIYHVDNFEAPRVQSSNDVAQVKVVTGQFENTRSLVQTDWPTDLLQLKWLRDGSVTIDLNPRQTSFVLNLSEAITVGEGNRLILSKYSGIAACNVGTEASRFEINAPKGSNVVIIRSQVIDEPSIFHGPFVATDSQEMNRIVDRYRRGEFGNLLPRNEE